MSTWQQFGIYRILVEQHGTPNPHLDTESDLTNHRGWLETWQVGHDTYFYVAGDLPPYMHDMLRKMGEERGFKYF